MFELDWVQIPDGEFIFGISDEQRTSLRRLIWTEYGIEQMDTQSRDIVARLADRYRRAGHGTVFERSALSKEERHIFPEFDDPDGRGWYFEADRALEYIPAQRRMFLPTFYISRFPITHEQADEFFGSEEGKTLWRLKNFNDHPQLPEELTLEAAVAISKWLGTSIPTVYEWEKAARGNNARLYPWGNNWDPAREILALNFDQNPH